MRESSYIRDGIAVVRYSLLFGLAGRLRHPQSAVFGRELWRGLDLYYHALGGSFEHKAGDSQSLQGEIQLSTHGGLDLQAWSEPGMLHMPRRINRFSTRELNRELYYWLAAVLASERPVDGLDGLPPGVRHLLQGVATSARLLRRFPSLKDRYRRLCQEELSQRRTAFPDLKRASPSNLSLALESAFRTQLGAQTQCRNQALNEMIDQVRTGSRVEASSEWTARTVPFLPVPLWSCKRPRAHALRMPLFRSTRKPRATAQYESLSEAEFNPQFEPDQQPGLPAVPDRYVYPEWNCLTNSYLRNWCRLEEMKVKRGYRTELEPQFLELVDRVQKQFRLLHQEPHWNRNLEDGDDLDIDAYVSAFGNRKARGHQDSRFYRERSRQNRDLSVIILMDASRSTEAWIGKVRVIDIAKQSVAVLAQVLDAASDDFAMYSFSSDSRLRIRCDRIKTFDQSLDENVQRSLLAVKPRDYTRMGPIIRHLGAKLQNRSTRQKLLLILSDGRPHDPTDRYEGRYALEDTRKAIIEQRQRNVECFGLTIDREGPRYLKFLFGPGHYAVFSHLHSLPKVLPELYARLTDFAAQ